MIKHTTLCFLFNADNEVLMIEKKRGMGAGKLNFPGGKIEPGESPERAAQREVFEETGLEAGAVELAGSIEFRFAPGSKSWDNFCRVYRVKNFRGELVLDNEECRCFWQSLEAIPYERMWPDDRFWLPVFLKGEAFHRRYHFDAEDALIGEEVVDTPAQLLVDGSSGADAD